MTEHNDAPQQPPADWIKAIRRGEEDLAAGRVIRAKTVLAELEASNERMPTHIAKKAPNAA